MEIDGRSPSLTWAYSKFPQPLRGSPCFFVSPVNENHNDTVSHKGALGIPRGCRGNFGLPASLRTTRLAIWSFFACSRVRRRRFPTGRSPPGLRAKLTFNSHLRRCLNENQREKMQSLSDRSLSKYQIEVTEHV